MKIAGIACPSCGHDSSIIVDIRPNDRNGIRRRRKCRNCEHRFSTTEELGSGKPSLLYSCNQVQKLSTEISSMMESLKSAVTERIR